MTIQSKTSRTPLLGIQAARGVAALLVVLYHAERALALPQYVGHSPIGGVTGFGHAGVDFFFVLSGFIIAFVHHGDVDRPASLARYAWRRASRIYPPYWVVTLGAVAVTVIAHGVSDAPTAGHFIQSMLLLPHEINPILDVAWTLNRELVFYLLFGMAIVDRRLAMAGVAVVVALGVVSLPAWLAPLRPWGVVWYDALFPVGIAAAWLTRRAVVARPLALAVAGAVAFILAGLAENAGWLPGNNQLPGRIAYGLPSAMIIVGVATAERAGRLRVGPGWVLFGGMSYALYLVHTMILGYAARALSVLHAPLPGWAEFVVAVLAALGAGLFFHLWVERPLTVWTRQAVRPSSVG